MIKILFLEDEEVIQNIIKEYLIKDNYSVDTCVDGNQAIKLLKENTYDLAILDINVPGINGLGVLKYIRQDLNLDMGVIMLTAYDDLNYQVEAFDDYADDYITKPVSPLILLKRINVIIKRIGVKTIDDSSFIIDESSYKAFYQGKDLKLTVSEFLLLNTLSKGNGKVFNRNQLINQIFDEDYIVNDRIIDSHIKNLRKKLPINLIETVIGIGYRWKENEIKK